MEYLRGRGISAASTFFDISNAESTIAQAIYQNRAAISNWLISARNGSRLPAFTEVFDSVTGISMFNSQYGGMRLASGVLIVIENTPTRTGTSPYTIVTAYPQTNINLVQWLPNRAINYGWVGIVGSQ